MSEVSINLTNSTPDFIAKELRRVANQFDPWGPVRAAFLWGFIGAATVAAMNLADLWVCVGACHENAPAPPEKD